jgi:diguanylate cyclase (GGDEF)-like protein
MTGNGGNNIKDKLGSLRESYLGQLPAKIKKMEENCAALKEDAGNEITLKDMHMTAHSIAGTSASFGCKAIGKTAKSLETILKTVIEGKAEINDKTLSQISAHIAALYDLIKQPEYGMIENKTSECFSLSRGTVEEGKNKTVFLVEDDPFVLRNLEIQIGHFGYDVKAFERLEDFKKALRETTPSAIIIDIIFLEGGLAGIEAVQDIRKGGKNISIIFISNRSDLEARLQAVRAGGDAYFVKPVSITNLIERLDVLTTYKEVEPYRILIVEDDVELAEFYSTVLEAAGMRTRIVNDPLKALEPLIEFNPDLILMDKYMPGCDGQELAKVIRQTETFFSIPTVFLSSETNIFKQMTAMRMGGDDFLTKPIDPGVLVSSVFIRAERMRTVRSLMEKDSLTGLLNHTKTREQLDIAVERAKRSNSKCSFAMIDIDKFKLINDTYGHPAGDKVILSLARLLQQRMRKIDIVGRYGGEEFAVILSDADAASAFRVLDEIRVMFSKIGHQHEGKEFSATFSCGIAAFPDFKDAVTLCSEADKALYAAKKNGRNRVVIA